MTAEVIVRAHYDGLIVSFTDDGWFNATHAAARFGKPPTEWLRLPGTADYLAALERKYGIFPYLKTKRGAGGGTWLHPKLAVRFAQWLNADFAVWCDEQIDSIIRSKQSACVIAVEYLPGYHELHDKVRDLSAGSTNEKFVHLNVNRLINKTIGIAAGQRAGIATPTRSLLVVANTLATRALESANDHHDGYDKVKRALGALSQVLLAKDEAPLLAGNEASSSIPKPRKSEMKSITKARG